MNFFEFMKKNVNLKPSQEYTNVSIKNITLYYYKIWYFKMIYIISIFVIKNSLSYKHIFIGYICVPNTDTLGVLIRTVSVGHPISNQRAPY